LSIDLTGLRQSWPLPSAPKPIVIIGAGGIVDDAHLPAYRLAGFPLAGIFDINADRAQTLAAKWEIPAFSTLSEALAVPDAVFDLALPPSAHLSVLPQLPQGSAVLMQKPMGSDLAEATAILKLSGAPRS
jgi:predicted dehydrogenase